MASSTGRVLGWEQQYETKEFVWWPSFVHVWQYVCLCRHMHAVLLWHCVTVQ